MKKRELTPSTAFRTGDLYLFHPSNPHCPSASSLWGFYDKSEEEAIYLEHSTLDLSHFRLWHKLSKRYKYCRLATRDELRDYMYNFGVLGCLKNKVSR